MGAPSLHDAAQVLAGDEDLARLRRFLAECHEDIREYWPELDDDRARVRAALDLPAIDDLLAAFHAAAADHTYRPISEWGPLRSMLD